MRKDITISFSSFVFNIEINISSEFHFYSLRDLLNMPIVPIIQSIHRFLGAFHRFFSILFRPCRGMYEPLDQSITQKGWCDCEQGMVNRITPRFVPKWTFE